MKFLKIKSYAKINLSLNILGKLPSKLHRIESLVCFAELHDLLYLRYINSNVHRVYFKGKHSKGISKKNTVTNLLKLLDKKQLLNKQKFEIKIEKNIPQKSGLGGGSMNAANLIRYFLEKKLFKLKNEKIRNIIDIIGSDVILGIDSKNTILSSNRKLSRYKKKLNYHLLIVKPNFGCSTKLIYSKVRAFSKVKYSKPSISLFNKNNIINSNNDLEKIVFKQYPKIKRIKLFLSTLPNIIFSRMSGSGSSIVAYFHSKKAVDIARKEFKKKFKNYWCITSKTI
jgi:4-diphosphocytidyl-2-C-methyl-D-erythritol kinase